MAYNDKNRGNFYIEKGKLVMVDMSDKIKKIGVLDKRMFK